VSMSIMMMRLVRTLGFMSGFVGRGNDNGGLFA